MAFGLSQKIWGRHLIKFYFYFKQFSLW
jgi:hypothetical protein